MSIHYHLSISIIFQLEQPPVYAGAMLMVCNGGDNKVTGGTDFQNHAEDSQSRVTTESKFVNVRSWHKQ